MLGLVAPDDDGEERRLLLPAAGDGHPEHGRAMPASVCRSSGSSVRLPAKLTFGSVMVLPLSGAWPGGLPCPWNRGRWIPWHAARPPGASGEANEVGRTDQLPAIGRLRCRVGWWGACGWGRVCQQRPARSLHPGRGGRTRLPPRGLLAVRPRLSVHGFGACSPIEVDGRGVVTRARGSTLRRPCTPTSRSG
jgi:hypothetical protein